MIDLHDRISAVLARDERLLEVLVSASPAFAKLRNGAMRRTFARLVTVEQAARIAGVDAESLVARLNGALGSEPLPEVKPDAKPEVFAPIPAELLAIDPSRIVDLDVREELRKGHEPFGAIMDAARALGPVGVLRVRAIFEPAPLYAVFAKKGFAHATERLGPEDYRVWFHRDGSAPVVNKAEAAVVEEDDVVVIDVRDLEPPEPMVRTLEALAALRRGKTLVQLNVRVPQFLLPKLKERGFTWEVREQSPDLVRLFIRHANT